MSSMDIDPVREDGQSGRDRGDRRSRHRDEPDRRDRDSRPKDRDRVRERGDRDRDRDRGDRHRDRDRRDRRDPEADRERDKTRERGPRDRDRDRERGRGGHDGEHSGRRRRSMSPRHGALPGATDADSYSASREQRAREREDRNARRDDWDPRDRDRDRDRDDWGGGGGGGGGGRRDAGRRRNRDGRDRERRRSESPPRRREPTPDLTDVVSVLDRQRRMTQWDIKQPGYENVTAEQAKMSGMFPLPGAPRQQQGGGAGGGGGGGGHSQGSNRHNGHGQDHRDHHRDDRSGPLSGPVSSLSTPSTAVAALPAILNSLATKPQNPIQGKRLFVHNLPDGVTEPAITAFFNLAMNGLNVVSGPDPCLVAYLSTNKKFALVEFKTPEDATVGLAFDGAVMDNGSSEGGTNAPALSIIRPRDYITPPASGDATTGTNVPDSCDKVCVSNIPPYLTDDQLVELISSFGALKAFVLVKDPESHESQGIVFCEYADTAITGPAIENLNDMELADRRIRVRRACSGIAPPSGIPELGLPTSSSSSLHPLSHSTSASSTSATATTSHLGINSMERLAATKPSKVDESRVVRLLNMVTADELMDDDEFDEIVEDVESECAHFGPVVEIKVPRPGTGRHAVGVGKIFVKFERTDDARKALEALGGRKFAGRTVVATFYGEDYFDVGAW